jgi:N-acetylneuraminic acid mutarotase
MIYDPQANSWSVAATVGAPLWRTYYSIGWTGSKVIVWGGKNNGTYLNTGSMYDVQANSWSAMSVANAPAPRESLAFVYTGSKFMVWGGYNGTYHNTGGVYDPSTNTWAPMSGNNAPHGAWFNATSNGAIWTGNKMIVWGGNDGSQNLNSGGMFDPGDQQALTLGLQYLTPTLLTFVSSTQLSGPVRR